MQLKQLKTNAKRNANYAVRAASVLTVAALSLGAVNAEPMGAHGTFVARTNNLNPAPLAAAPVAPVVKQEIVVEQSAAPVAAAPTAQKATKRSGSGGGGCGLDTIKQRESGGNYAAQNKRSTASGAYQVLNGTWGGYGGYSRAGDAPAAVQDKFAGELYAKHGSSPWVVC